MSAAKTSAAESTDALLASSPLYITIGPPCSGKTAWLKQKQQLQQQEEESENGPSLIDISLDDQPNVYVPIPTELFSASSDTLSAMEGLPPDFQQLLQTSLFQKTVQQRLLVAEQQELRWVLQRLSGKMSKDEFEQSLRSLFQVASRDNGRTAGSQHMISRTSSKENHSDELVTSLLNSVERVMAEHEDTTAALPLPETVDLFVVEALFRKNPDCVNSAQGSNNWTGIERATNVLKQTPKTTTVAWGNTNTKPRDMEAALEIAELQGRQVHFCIFDSGASVESEASLFDLPHVGYPQLVDRNIQRLLHSGRYVPSKAMWDASKRVETLISDALRQIRDQKRATTTGNIQYMPTKLDLDRQLARLAQFDMRDDNTVSKMATRYYDQNKNGRSQPRRQLNLNHRGRHSNQFNRTSASQSSWRSNSNRGPSQNRQHDQQNHHQQNSPQFRPVPPSRGHAQGNDNSRPNNTPAPPPPPSSGGGGGRSSPGYNNQDTQSQNYQPRDQKPGSSTALGSSDEGRDYKRSRGQDWDGKKNGVRR